MNSDLKKCSENDEGTATSRTLIEAHPALQRFFDRSKPSNAVGFERESLLSTLGAEAFRRNWVDYFAVPTPGHKLPIPLPQPAVDYQDRVRRRKLIVPVTFTASDIEHGNRLVYHLSNQQIRRMFQSCDDSRHGHEVALIRVELTRFDSSGFLNCHRDRLTMSLQMTSKVPDPQPAKPNGMDALRHKSWFEPCVFLADPHSKDLEAHPCVLRCNSLHALEVSETLYEETGKTGIRSFAILESLRTVKSLVRLVPEDPESIELPAPRFNGKSNEVDHFFVIWVLEWLKKRGSAPQIVERQKQHYLRLKKYDYDAVFREFEVDLKQGSGCILRDELVFTFEPIHVKTDWSAFLQKNRENLLSVTAELTLYGIVTGHSLDGRA